MIPPKPIPTNPTGERTRMQSICIWEVDSAGRVYHVKGWTKVVGASKKETKKQRIKQPMQVNQEVLL